MATSVQVAAGQTTATFPITTTAGPDATVTITASIGASSDAAQLTIKDAPDLIDIDSYFTCYDVGGVDVPGGVVHLDLPSPTNTFVSIASSNPGVMTVSGGGTTVPMGQSNSVFQVTTLSTGTTTLTASLNGVDVTTPAVVRDPNVTPSVITDISLNPTSVAPGGSSIATVTLDCEGVPGGTTVNLSSDDPNVTVPGSVVVPQGQRGVTFMVNTNAMATGTATITATTGAVSDQASLTVN